MGKQYKGSKTALIADVDCTAAGKDLCEQNGVQGFPTIKWGDPSSLEDYDGGRSFDDLQTFAKDNLKPLCSPVNIDLCDDEKKAMINELMALETAELMSKIEAKEAELKEAETTFETELEKLQKRYSELEKEKTEKQTAVK